MVGKDKKRGTYYVQIKYRDQVTLKQRAIRKRGFKTKKEAEKWEREYFLQNSKPISNTNKFSEIFDIWCNYLQSSEATIKKKKSLMEMYFKFYDKEFNLIKKEKLLNWMINDLNQQKLSTRTKNNVIQIVQSVCRFATDLYGVPNEAVMLKKIKRSLNEYVEMSTWSPYEFNEFLNFVDNKIYKLFFEVLFWTGMRRGECLALTKGCISKEGLITINKSIKHYKNGFLPLKNRSSYREVQLDNKTLQDIKELLDGKADEFVFGNERSLPISCVQRKFTNALDKSGLSKIRLHDFRHSHATILINNGVNVVAVSKRLGHATIDQTLKTYTHLLEKTNQEMMAKLDELRF